MTAVCFTCRAAPAGHRANPCSAYCERCQPASRPRQRGNGCGACGQAFGTLTSFDHHQRLSGGRVACTHPVVLGLVRDVHGTWQTPAGLVTRERTRRMTAGWNSSG